MVAVPEQYQSLIQAAATGINVPVGVVAAQVNEESGFNPTAESPTGAEGMFQFEPGTYDSVAAAAGVPEGSEFNPQDEEKAYVVYMNQLLQEEGGSIQKALEAYNAGPGDLAAGASYASTILSAANEPVTSTGGGGPSGSASGGSQAETTGLNWNPLDLFGIPSEATTAGAAAEEQVWSDITNAAWQSFMSVTGISGLKDFMVRAGLIILGFTILIIALIKLFDVHPVATAVKVGKTAAIV
jgi:hypothetical protein